MIWNLSNSTRYAAAATLAADRNGHDIWLTLVKTSFDVAPDGHLTPSSQQWPVVYAPLFAGDPTRSSLLAESDIDYAKPGVDVLVQGTARSPDGAPVRDMLVALEVDGRRKVLRVHGERVWSRGALGITPSDVQPFTQMPLAYEHAFGGFDPSEDGGFDLRNPAGRGYARKLADLVGQPAPRVEYVNEPVSEAGSRPAGFGPIARHWMPRRRYAGTYDQTWTAQRMPLLPSDFDERYFCAAPEDQQFAQLPPQALIRVAGMGPQGVMSFRLPRLALGLNIQVRRQGISRRPLLRTVLVLPDPRQVVLTFADAMPCTGFKFSIVDTEVIEKEFVQ